MSKLERRIFAVVWLGTGALLVGMILAAPVMREPANDPMNATASFGDAQ